MWDKAIGFQTATHGGCLHPQLQQGQRQLRPVFEGVVGVEEEVLGGAVAAGDAQGGAGLTPTAPDPERTMAARRDEFLARLAAEFPAVIAGFGEYSSGLLHCEVGDFRQATERAMDAGRLWEAEGHFRLVAELLALAGPELRNALEISYLEDLALGEFTPARHLAIKERMPKHLRAILIGHHRDWQ